MRSLLLAALAAGAMASPMWDYVHKPDPTYSWFDTGVRLNKQDGWTGYLLNMTSQSWLSPADSTRYVWTHQLLVVVPANYNPTFGNTAALWITGGDNNNPGTPDPTDEDVLVCAALSTNSGTVCAVLYQVPNQPIVFAADPLQKERSEDAAVAFTWYNYMINHPDDAEWVLYCPMAKAAVRALDTIEAFVPTIIKGASPSQFMAFGASKRGATTWFTGAMDKRVIGIAPVVFDILNFKAGVQGMWQSLGGWTFAFVDYYDMNIPAYFGTPYVDILASVVDPLQYAENLTMSKLVIDATGDEFFQVQDDHYWWGQLPGESLRMMVDNAEHSMATGALYLITGVEAWYAALLRGYPRPTFNWTISPVDGSITINAYGAKPSDVVLRFATTVDGNVRRDFRLVSGNTPANPCKYIPVQIFGSACIKPIIWVGESVAPVSNTTGAAEAEEDFDGFHLGPEGWTAGTAADGSTPVWTYVLTQPLPPTGWRGFLGELYYPGPPGTNTTFQLTTQVSVIPNTFPYPPCNGTGCMGPLV